LSGVAPVGLTLSGGIELGEESEFGYHEVKVGSNLGKNLELALGY
jgi:hypothetical protein